MSSNLAPAASPAETIQITHDGEVFAIIVPATFHQPGVSFFTPDSYSQQLAFISHKAGHKIEPHVHNPVRREVTYTNEVLFIRRGLLRVDFYDEEKRYLTSYILGAGDAILLIKGGHGFEVLDEVEMIEAKQGPYTGENDKERFSGPPPRLKFFRSR